MAAVAVVARVPVFSQFARTQRVAGVDVRDEPDFKALSMRALDAARSAGASYADVRFTVTRRRTFTNGDAPTESTRYAVGVRALASGAWGFAAHSECTPDRVVTLARSAAEQAQVVAWPRVPPIELLDHPPAATGHWQTPIKRNPFDVSALEVRELMTQAAGAMHQLGGGFGAVLTFERQSRSFASTDGAFVTQDVYTSLGGTPHEDLLPSTVQITAQSADGQRQVVYTPSVFSPCGKGYEAVEDAKIVEHLPEWYAAARALLDAKPLSTLGRFDVVFDGNAMAAIVDGAFGAALEYDRVIGYEANASGTSYLTPPLKVLGTAIASPSVTITADRTMSAGAGTVAWDDEGVAPQPFSLITKGVMMNYATTREFVGELTPWYQKQHVAPRSMGCSAAESGMTVPLVCTPNLVLQPNATDTKMDALLSGIKTGYAVLGGDVTMDIQQRSGQGTMPQLYQVKNGVLGEPVAKAMFTFTNTDLWKNLVALGGTSTSVSRGMNTSKGQPDQASVHSVQAVAARFKDVRIVPTDRV